MAKCEICEKSLSHGNKISIARSHVSRRASRTWRPNLRTIKDVKWRNKKNFCMC